MSDYTFLPWIRRGVGRAVGQTHTLATASAGRTAITVGIDVNGTPVEIPILLHGPGDAAGLDPRAVRRVEPAPDTGDAEPYLFAAVELAHPELPWLLTPAGSDADGRLLPWLALLVVPDEAASITLVERGLPRLEVPAAELPPPAESWSWAHAQYTGTLDRPLDESLDASPERWLARILSPRRLDPGMSWQAFLVPLFAAGRVAGLGEPLSGSPLEFAWDPGATGSVTLPVYHRWRFATAPTGDFETLARRLEARELPEGVGRLQADFSRPGAGVRGTDAELFVEGALQRFRQAQPPLPPDAERTAEDLEDLVGRGVDPLVVTPPLYGADYVETDLDAGWTREVNVDPRVRAIAGLGLEVVRRNQDELVASAWRQLGEVREANRLLGWLTLAREIGTGLHRKHFAPASLDTLVQWSAPAHTKIRIEPAVPRTLARDLLTHAVVPSAAQPAVRRALRATGPLVTRARVGSPGRAAETTERGTRGTRAASRAASLRGLTGLVSTLGERPVVADPWPLTPAAGLVTLEAVFAALGQPGGQAAFQLDRITSGVIDVESRLRRRYAIVDEAGAPTDLPDARGTFGRAAHAAQEASLRALALARRPSPAGDLVPLDRDLLLEALDPGPRFEALARQRVRLPQDAGAPRGDLDPVRIAPRFPQPTVRVLQTLFEQFLLPGLDRVPANTVTLVETNSRFVEAFLLGMNRELRRELLWREFPTESRATFFRRFWDTPAGLEDIEEISAWPPATELGTHAPGEPAATVLVVRGDLIRRFPGIALYAVPTLAGRADPEPAHEVHPVMRGALEPDVIFAGFPFGPDDADDYHYVLQQQPSAPRFGLDAESALAASAVTRRNDLSWQHMPPDEVFATPAGPLAGRTLGDGNRSAVWGRNGADMAWLTLQLPIRIVLPASTMIPGTVPQ